MLEFWFDPNLPILKKISFFIILALVTVLLYIYAPLKPDAILMFLGTGIIFLICRYCKLHFTRTRNTLARLLTWIPIALFLALVFMHQQQGEILIPGVQGLGFMALGICLFSPMALFANPNTPPPSGSKH